MVGPKGGGASHRAPPKYATVHKSHLTLCAQEVNFRKKIERGAHNFSLKVRIFE